MSCKVVMISSVTTFARKAYERNKFGLSQMTEKNNVQGHDPNILKLLASQIPTFTTSFMKGIC